MKGRDKGSVARDYAMLFSECTKRSEQVETASKVDLRRNVR